MRFWQQTLVYKAVCVARYLVLRAAHGRRFEGRGLSMIGQRNIFVLQPGASAQFGDHVILADDVHLESAGRLKLGNRVCVNRYSRIIAHESIEIGDDVTLAQFVVVLDHDHAFALRNGRLQLEGFSTAPIKIGNNVWLGDRCMVLRGVTIGDNVVAGAHTLINKNVPPNSVIGGTPFRILRTLT